MDSLDNFISGLRTKIIRIILAIVAILIVATFLLWPKSADAKSSNCASHDLIVEQLANTYGESRQMIAIGADGAVVEVFASHETGTWSITVSQPGGPTCLVAAGEAFQLTPNDIPDLSSPTALRGEPWSL